MAGIFDNVINDAKEEGKKFVTDEIGQVTGHHKDSNSQDESERQPIQDTGLNSAQPKHTENNSLNSETETQQLSESNSTNMNNTMPLEVQNQMGEYGSANSENDNQVT